MTLNKRQQSLIAFLYFFIAASLGLTLRIFAIADVPINYTFFLHTHSHIALLGWVYTALITLINHLFLPQSAQKKYLRIFWFTQFTILGMLFSFPFQGYALYSIFFSTSFLIASYWFLSFFLKNVKKEKKQLTSYPFIKTSLWFMVFSSIGPWCLGIIMNTLGKSSIWYKTAIYFYLHFQYNGWFLMALFGFFFYFLEQKLNIIKSKQLRLFYKLTTISILLTFFLSVLFTKPSFIFYLLAFVGSTLQLVAFYIFSLFLKRNNIYQKIKKEAPFITHILQTIFILYFLKIILQALTSIPYFSNLAYQFTDFVIGYIHLVFLGIVTLSLFAFLTIFHFIKLPKKSYFLFLSGFILSEILIFYKAISFWLSFQLPNYFLILLVLASSLMPVAILYLLITTILDKKTVTKQLF